MSLNPNRILPPAQRADGRARDLDRRVAALERTGYPDAAKKLHADTHRAGGSDPVQITQAQVDGLVADLAALAAAVAPPLVASLPGSPADGDTIRFQDATMAAAGVVWTLRYRAGASGSYKWEFCGGGELAAAISDEETTASTTYTDLTTAGPALDLPLDGDYVLRTGATLSNDTAGEVSYVSFDRGATAADDADAIQHYEADVSAAQSESASRMIPLSGVSAMTLTAKYRVSGGTGTFAHRWMTAVPIRVG